jgi:dTMP kinase
MLDELVAPALAAGRTVVCERFHGSTFAYQGSAGGVDEERLLELFGAWAGEPAPDATFLLEIDPALAAARAAARAPGDRIEARGLDFQRRVAAGLRRYAQRARGVVRIDASGSADQVEALLLAEVRRAR